MATYTKDQGGPSILSDLKSRLAKANADIRLVVARDDLPAEYRRRIRNETIAETKRLADDARAAFVDWARTEAIDARKRYQDDPVGSAADETRRLRREMEINRLVDAARLADERGGVKMIGGRPVNNASAHDLAAKAQQAYLDGDYERAQVYATASTTLGGPQSAQDAYDAAQGQLDLANPTRAQALKDLANVERGLRTFERESNAALADAYQQAAQAAVAMGDDPREFNKAALGPSMAAKFAAMAEAQATGTDYVEPAGVLPGVPAQSLRPTDAELARVTSRTS